MLPGLNAKSNMCTNILFDVEVHLDAVYAVQLRTSSEIIINNQIKHNVIKPRLEESKFVGR